MMSTPPDALWQRIAGFDFDALSLAHKLARMHGWSSDFTARAIDEYRRFTYLCCTAGRMMSPSQIVDEVWHLHLTYSRDYWDNWCARVLARPLHHEPSDGPHENDKHREAYSLTLDRYHETFGETAPPDIWPARAPVGADSPDQLLIDRKTAWCVRKPRAWAAMHTYVHRLARRLSLTPSWIDHRRPLQAAHRLSLVVLLSLLAVGCGTGLGNHYPFNLHGPEFLGLYWQLALMALTGALFLRWWLRFPGGTPPLSLKRDPYVTAFTQGGPVLVLNAALASLVHRCIFEIDKDGTLKRHAYRNLPALSMNRLMSSLRACMIL